MSDPSKPDRSGPPSRPRGEPSGNKPGLTGPPTNGPIVPGIIIYGGHGEIIYYSDR